MKKLTTLFAMIIIAATTIGQQDLTVQKSRTHSNSTSLKSSSKSMSGAIVALNNYLPGTTTKNEQITPSKIFTQFLIDENGKTAYRFSHVGSPQT